MADAKTAPIIVARIIITARDWLNRQNRKVTWTGAAFWMARMLAKIARQAEMMR